VLVAIFVLYLCIVCRIRTEDGAVLGKRDQHEAGPEFPELPASRSLSGVKIWWNFEGLDFV
jgi:hypothetical protein